MKNVRNLKKYQKNTAETCLFP